MLNNPNQNVHTDYETSDVFKPAEANQLARSTPFDYVITQTMLDKFRTDNSLGPTDWVDIGDLILDRGSADDLEKKPAISVFFNCKTTESDHFNVGGRLATGDFFSTNDYIVHIYSLGPYISSGRAYPTFHHTAGDSNYVVLNDYSGGFFRTAPCYVGSFKNPDDVEWSGSDTTPFIYEYAIDGNVPQPIGGNPYAVMKRQNWMSNSLGGAGESTRFYASDAVLDTDYDYHYFITSSNDAFNLTVNTTGLTDNKIYKVNGVLVEGTASFLYNLKFYGVSGYKLYGYRQNGTNLSSTAVTVSCNAPVGICKSGNRIYIIGY